MGRRVQEMASRWGAAATQAALLLIFPESSSVLLLFPSLLMELAALSSKGICIDANHGSTELSLTGSRIRSFNLISNDHKTKKKEKEYIKLQERLNQALMEKKKEASRSGMEIMNLLQVLCL